MLFSFEIICFPCFSGMPGNLLFKLSALTTINNYICILHLHLQITGIPLHKGLLGGAKANDDLRLKASPKPYRLSKGLAAAKIVKASPLKLAGTLPQKDSDKKALLPKDDDLRNLTCKSKTTWHVLTAQ